jgi:hypothetical protein
MRSNKDKFQSRAATFSYFLACIVLVLTWATTTNSQTQSAKRMVKVRSEEVQQPVYMEYRGVRLGMTMEEARAKLGVPTMKSDELDFYVLSANETSQIAYSAAHKVVTISTDYTDGVSAPDYKTVVGNSPLIARPDGSIYQMVQYEAAGFWVSYNKSVGAVPVVTVTIQVLPK